MIIVRMSMTMKDEDKKVEAWMTAKFHGCTKKEVEEEVLDGLKGDLTWKVEFIKEE